MNLFKSLFYLHSVDDSALADDAAGFSRRYGNAIASGQAFAPLGHHRRASTPAPATPAPAPADTARTTPTEAPERWGVLDTLALLGGRPMCTGHNFDVDDPIGCR